MSICFCFINSIIDNCHVHCMCMLCVRRTFFYHLYVIDVGFLPFLVAHHFAIQRALRMRVTSNGLAQKLGHRTGGLVTMFGMFVVYRPALAPHARITAYTRYQNRVHIIEQLDSYVSCFWWESKINVYQECLVWIFIIFFFFFFFFNS